MAYPYLPLSPDSPEIRLLTMTYTPNPDSEDPANDYTLTLTHHPLTPSLDFTALSYVWGPPDPAQSMVVDTHAVQIRPSVHSALVRLQRQRWQGRIWIDAICINQDDTAEKNAQVAMMGRIYRMTRQVLAWLGPEPGLDVTAGLAVAELMGGLWAQFARHPSGAVHKPTAEALVKMIVRTSITAERDSPEEGGYDFELMARLFLERRWFQRVWVVQEVVLARQAVVLCGEDPEAYGASVPWGTVRDCGRLFQWMMLHQDHSPEHRRLYSLVQDMSHRLAPFAMASEGYRQTLEENEGADKDDVGMKLLDTLIIVCTTGSVQATDPRDRIYGILGFVREEDRRKIVVDYSSEMTLSKVLFAVGKTLLQDIGPRLLSLSQKPLRSGFPSLELPSWVPDWTATQIPVIDDSIANVERVDWNRNNTSTWPGWRNWAASSHIQDAVFENPVVCLPGIIVGRVDKIGRWAKPHGGVLSAHDARAWLLDLCRMVLEEGVGPGGAALNELWRVPIADSGLGDLVSTEKVEESNMFKRGYEVLTGRLPPPERLGTDEAIQDWVSSESWEYRRVWRDANRRACIDGSGRPGMGPEDMKPGDLIVSFAGAHVPYVLREQTGSAHKRYYLVGSAYIQDFDCEAITDGASFDEIHIA